MLDFFRDIYLESKGIDCEKAELERLEKKKNKEKEKVIIPNGTKAIIYSFTAFYIISNIVMIPMYFKIGNWFIFSKVIIQIVLACAIDIMIFIKKKKTEFIGIILIVLFIVLQYSSIMLNCF